MKEGYTIEAAGRDGDGEWRVWNVDFRYYTTCWQEKRMVYRTKTAGRGVVILGPRGRRYMHDDGSCSCMNSITDADCFHRGLVRAHRGAETMPPSAA